MNKRPSTNLGIFQTGSNITTKIQNKRISSHNSDLSNMQVERRSSRVASSGGSSGGINSSHSQSNIKDSSNKRLLVKANPVGT